MKMNPHTCFRPLRSLPNSCAEHHLSWQEIAKPRSPAAHRTGRVVGKIGEEYLLLSTDEIYAFQAEVDSVWIVTAKTQVFHALDEPAPARIPRSAVLLSPPHSAPACPWVLDASSPSVVIGMLCFAQYSRRVIRKRLANPS